jgi:hypothetical protein
MNAERAACGPVALEVVVGARHLVVAPAQRFVVGRGGRV